MNYQTNLKKYSHSSQIINQSKYNDDNDGDWDDIHIDQHYGFITFISEQYLTLCIHEYTKPKQIAEGARCKYNQCNVLIFREQWNDIRRTTDIHQRYIERTNLHPVE